MLSKRVKYAIKTLLFLNRKDNSSLFSAKKISENERIPLKFLEQILRELKQNKILKSERGAEGGYTLMKDPADIKVLDVIRIVDGPVALLPCASLNFYEKCSDCRDEATCSIRKLLINVRDNMLPVLDTSIADMTRSETTPI
ncbi:RrF2 family transcriptional regulator [Epilithonimonas lactis]|uniref:Rrf2 family transcriptional regulator n=1 Tax=Epilithonimonas lactis TaxID=421072 RepID=A0A085BMZ6_9FLAO|nr:Rrf2 family transcriptional regulator [Epilithonimonas lactis]KFC23841.1 Rrf2 family transcriptional regulator [Epilithonimonas lactis]SEQ27287.1 transcriptional regulator, BadM/Rrf2 family [Epilithonimonas lactis]